MQFVADVTVPDGTIFGPNEPFVKTWRMRNAGSCNWTGYRVVFSDGEPMGTMEQAIPDTPAGEELDISIEMTAPGGTGNYTGRWRVESPAGANLGILTCVIVVEGGEAPSGGEEAPPGGEEAPPGGGEAQQPDLEIGEVSVWVPMPTEPKTVAVIIEVRNVGNGPAGAFTVRWYPHERSNEVGCSLDVMGLPANSAQILDDCPSYTYAQHGEMHWRAVVDEDNEIQNDPKGNNQARGTIRIEAGGGGGQQPQPDLAIGAIAVNPSSPKVGEPAVATVWVTNQGNAESGPFPLQWQSGEPPAAGVWCDWNVGSLPPGESASQSCNYTYHNAGTFTMRALVDGLSQIAEADEGNNVREQAITVVAAGPVGQPDLVIRDLMIIPDDTVKPGEQFGVTFRVQNNGNAPAGPSTAYWETAGSTGLSCDCNVPEVGVGGSHRCDCSPLVAPSAPKNYGTWATADYGKVVAESDEGNNKSESAVLKVHQ